MSMRELQEALPTWVRMERPSGTPEVSAHQVGGVNVVEVNAFPETPAEAPVDEVGANVHFVEIVRTESFPDKDELIATVKGAFGEGEWAAMGAEDLAGGPSYITLGGWLGSQDLALMLIGAVELAGLAPAITPAALGMTGEIADAMAGNGLVMLGPFDWAAA